MFAVGAPALLAGRNINTSRGITNNTSCTLHDLTLDPATTDVDATWAAIRATAPGEIYCLPAPPLSVNVCLTSLRSESWPAADTLQPGKIVIPIMESKWAAAIDRPFPIRFYSCGGELAFSYTVDKCQGQTLHRVLLDLNGPRRSLPALYVACSRVRHRDHIRVLPLVPAAKTALLQLGHSKHLVEWVKELAVMYSTHLI